MKNNDKQLENFSKLGISLQVLESIKKEGFENPTEIQEKTIPPVLSGRDVIACSATGSGKTLAFGVGLIQKAQTGEGIQGLVVTPTRELALQATRELEKFSKKKQLEVTCVYGGVGFEGQARKLKETEIVVGTPGRLLDHMNRRTLKLENVEVLVLDEADKMLEMGFIDDVKKIIRACPKKRQTLLFSATIPREVVRISEKFMENPISISAKENVDPNKLKQIYYHASGKMKFSLLTHLISEDKTGVSMVFGNTRRIVDYIAHNLQNAGINAEALHGGFSQDKRTRVMKKFHMKKFNVLVCTDVAARGLDIKGVTHVYNYDVPDDPKEYIHRIGRTARAGEEGLAVTLLTEKQHKEFRMVLSKNKVKVTEKDTPEFPKVFTTQIESKPRSGRGGRSRSEGRRRDGPRSEGSGERSRPEGSGGGRRRGRGNSQRRR